MDEVTKKMRNYVFPPEAIEWKPMVCNDDKTSCKPAIYADTRAYYDALDELCEEWHIESVELQYSPDSTRAYARVQVEADGHIAIGDGNALLYYGGKSERPDENAELSATAQAFKRACTVLGLGRYLYGIDLPKNMAWLETNGKRNPRFTKESMQRLEAFYRSYYAKRTGKSVSAQTGAEVDREISTEDSGEVPSGEDLPKTKKEWFAWIPKVINVEKDPARKKWLIGLGKQVAEGALGIEEAANLALHGSPE